MDENWSNPRWAGIAHAAARAFANYGYEGTSMSAIAAEAGIAKGAIYFSFKTKAELAQVLVERQQDAVEDLFAESASWGIGPTERIGRICARLARQAATDPIMGSGIRLSLEMPRFQSNRKPYETWMKEIVLLAEEGKTVGELREDIDPVTFARIALSLFVGLQVTTLTLEDLETLETQSRTAWEFLLAGVAS
ncbi:TetR/AcrR family transcriptional regulator [Leucobacter luti]|nr:TetR/AcrR family transcriptional regulator [Leucobacter luti]